MLLHVQVMGPGMVSLDGGGSCTMDCMLPAPLGLPATLHALPGNKQKFDRWTSTTCAGQSDTCTFTPTAPVTVSAHFVKDN